MSATDISPYLFTEDKPSRELIKKCDVMQLKSLLQSLGLPAQGKKPELVERVFEFFNNLQNPDEVSTVQPSHSVKFRLESTRPPEEIRFFLERFGVLRFFFYDPTDSVCYVTFESTTSSSKLMGSADDNHLLEAKYILDGELEQAVHDSGIIPTDSRLSDVPFSNFRKTTCEPHLFWKENIVQ